MGEQYRFSAPIERSGNGAYVTVPFDAEAVWGKKRVPVRATIDGIAYRGSLVRMGGRRHVLGVVKEIRSALARTKGTSSRSCSSTTPHRAWSTFRLTLQPRWRLSRRRPRIRGARLQSQARGCPLDRGGQTRFDAIRPDRPGGGDAQARGEAGLAVPRRDGHPARRAGAVALD